MFEAFLITVTLVLAIFGLSELFHMVCYKVLKPKKDAKKILILVLTEDDAEQQLLALIEELKWQGSRYANILVAFTGELSPEKTKICRERFTGNGIYFTNTFDFLKYECRSK